MTHLDQLCEPRDQAPYLQAADEMIKEGLIEALEEGGTEMHIGFLPAHVRNELLRRAEQIIEENKTAH